MEETENSAISRIINAEIVLQHFGYWPDFHDAVISKVTFEVQSSSSMTFLITTCETTDEVEEQGYYKQIKHCEIELQFLGIQETVFSLDHQPIIFILSFRARGNSIMCSIASSAENIVIVAEKIVVKSLTPITPIPDEPRE